MRSLVTHIRFMARCEDSSAVRSSILYFASQHSMSKMLKEVNHRELNQYVEHSCSFFRVLKRSLESERTISWNCKAQVCSLHNSLRYQTVYRLWKGLMGLAISGINIPSGLRYLQKGPRGRPFG